jgi:hypothetical protein
VLAKIVFLIVGMATIACSVLAIRQSRLQTASEIVQAQVRINAMDERLAALRIAVAEQVAPERVREMAADLDDLIPLAQAAGDVARQTREEQAAKLEAARQAAQENAERARRAAPQSDPGSLHNPDGSPRNQPSPSRSRDRSQPTRRPGGAA